MLNMVKILCIESAENVCSVCLSVDGVAHFLKESVYNCDHARLLAPFIAQIFAEADITAHDLDAVAISKGPGSYTGLRIGAATAKGLCYAAKKPLIAVGTLDVLAQIAIQRIQDGGQDNVANGANDKYKDITQICSVLDARRMEVYAAFFGRCGCSLTNAEPIVLDEHSFAEELCQGKTLFVGSGAQKCEETIHHANAQFMPLCLSSCGLAALAQERYDKQQFEDIVSFEPFYLKSFAATQAKRGMQCV
jgi:tRNA threonylcarbamoyladenosine biosynthesis protein TsaB